MCLDLIKEKLFACCHNIFQSNLDIDIGTIEFVDFVDDFGMDSLSFITLIIEIEDTFGVIIPDDVLLIENFRTIDTIANIILQNVPKVGD